jgi:TBC1 domain family protein 5
LLTKNRLKYKALLNKFVTVDSDANNSSAVISTATTASLTNGKLNLISEEALLDPLSDSWYGPGDEKLTDEQLLDIITKDVERTYPDIDFFRQDEIQKSLTNILFIYAKVNKDISYKQGMHELAAPMLWVLAKDAHTIKSDDPAFITMFDINSIEADAYEMFNQVMKSAKAWYLNDAETIPPIVAKSIHIQDDLVQRADPEMYQTLKDNSIEPQIWGIRWIRLLFGREFGFDNMLALWDALFANFEQRPDDVEEQLEIIDYVCVVMLLRVKEQIITGDHTDILTTLLNYPVDEQTYETMYLYVTNALYLQRNLTASAGKYICDQYNSSSRKGSGSKTDFFKSPPGTPTSRSSSRNSSTPISRINNNHASTTSRPLSRVGFDSLMDKAKIYSKSVIDQTQKWDVDRIVRQKLIDVRTKAKHGLDNAINAKMQVETPSSTLGTDQGRQIRLIAERDLRDEQLAAMIAKALEVLEVQIKASPDDNEAVASSFQCLWQVEKCLRDPSAFISIDGVSSSVYGSTPAITRLLPSNDVKRIKGSSSKMVAEPGLTNPAATRSRSSSPVKVPRREPTTPVTIFPQPSLSTSSRQSSENSDIPGTPTTSTRPVTTTTPTASSNSGGTSSTESTPTKKVFKSPTRTSLAQSEFAWMVSEASSSTSNSSGFVKSKFGGGASKKKKMLFGGVGSTSNIINSSKSTSRFEKTLASSTEAAVSAADLGGAAGPGLDRVTVPEKADNNNLFELK